MAFTTGQLTNIVTAISKHLDQVAFMKVYLGNGGGTLGDNTPTTPESRQNTGLDSQIVASVKNLSFEYSGSFGDNTTQFDITNPVPGTTKYEWDGNGLDPTFDEGIKYLAIGAYIIINSPNFNAANNGIFLVTDVDAAGDWFEVTTAGFPENNKTLGIDNAMYVVTQAFLDDNQSWTDADFVDEYIGEIGFYKIDGTTLQARWIVPLYRPAKLFEATCTLEMLIDIIISVTELEQW